MRLPLAAALLVTLAACSAPMQQDASSDARADARVDSPADAPVDAIAEDVVPTDTGPLLCATDRDCADGLFCNGIERCSPSATGADMRGCLAAASPPCGSMMCNEATRDCELPCPPAESLGPCTSDNDCDDHVACNGSENCVTGFCHRTPLVCPSGQFCAESVGACTTTCDTAADCDDGMWCNGTEQCVRGVCQPPASTPCPTVAGCDEAMDQCTTCTTDAHCNDGRYCNGREACGPSGTCIRNLLVPCTARSCNESTDTCGCLTDANCDDGQYCNGPERCTSGTCVAGRAPCPTYLFGTTMPACSEATDTCAVPLRRCMTNDECRDGSFCNGAEVCNPSAPGANAFGCIQGSAPCAASEVCDESMRRCTPVCTTDADGDGHRSLSCGGDDCDDHDAMRFPGNPEVCAVGGDLHDEDCDPTTVGTMTANDSDRDGQIDVSCCNARRGMPPICGEDCDDTRSTVRLGAAELCDGVDNNCDGTADEGVTELRYLDSDGDGAGTSTCSRQVCAGAAGYVANQNDCNDADATLGAGAQQCGSGADGTEIWICSSTGVWSRSSCTGGQACSAEPNGTGSCR